MSKKNNRKNNWDENMPKKESIAVVGLGYVGLPLALLADRKGYQVFGIDNNEMKVEKINQKIMPYEDTDLVEKLSRSGLIATTDWKFLKEVSTVIICVPTPVTNHHEPDLEPVKNACIKVAKYLHRGQLIILESTVNPGVCDEIVIPILEEESGLKAGKDFYLAHCPERINPGDKKWNVENIPRVIGSYDDIGLEKAINFYKSIITGDVRAMRSLKEAEAVKIVENSFRDINIAFVNELAQSFSHLGIDVVSVIQGASTKPFSFLPHFPGCGVGGHCIPVDPYYLIEYAKKNGFKHRFLSLARKINNSMPKFTASLVENALAGRFESLQGVKITVLGLAYKANIGDCRESPSFEIVRHLKKKGANVTVFDPHVLDLSTAKNIDEAVQDAEAVVVATDHNEFKNLSPEFFLKHNVDIIIDGRNCLAEMNFIKAGLMYEGIGKHHVYPHNDLIKISNSPLEKIISPNKTI